MAAITVTSANNNEVTNSNRVCLRTSAGIPYVVVHNYSTDDIEIYKGNSATPTSFAEQDTADNPATGTLGCVSAAIDSTGVIHIVYMSYISKSDDLIYVTYNTNTDQWGTPETINADLGAESTSLANLYTSIAIDSNDIPHVAYVGVEANAGTVGYVVRYENRIGGAWIGTGVEVEGQTANIDCKIPSITIDADNIPEISYQYSENIPPYTDVRGAIGNANDATSFTLQTIYDNTVYGSTQFTSICIDSSGNTYIAGKEASNGYLKISKHTYGNNWATWSDVSPANKTFSTGVSLVANGTDIYAFIEDATTSDIQYEKYSSGAWSGSWTTLETGTFNTVKAKWAYWVDYDSTGANRGAKTGGSNGSRTELDYVFTDETASPDIWWNTLTLTQGGSATGTATGRKTANAFAHFNNPAIV